MEALSTVVPFFGVMVVTVCGGLTCMSRRLTALTRRVEALELGTQQPTLPPTPNHIVGVAKLPAWTPPSLPQPQPQSMWPNYPAYMTTTYQTPPPVSHPYPTAPPQHELR